MTEIYFAKFTNVSTIQSFPTYCMYGMCVLHRIIVAMHVCNLLKVVIQLCTCIHASLIDSIFIGKSNKKNEYSDLTGLVSTSVYTYIYVCIPSTSTIH